METKSEPDFVDLTDDENALKSPQRKLKQARLPFHILGPKPGDGQAQAKKRKISGSASEGRIQKTSKQEDDGSQKSPVNKTQARDVMSTPVSKAANKTQKQKKCSSGKSPKNCSPSSERENHPENSKTYRSPKDSLDQEHKPKSEQLGGSPKNELSKSKTKNILQKFLSSSPSGRNTNNSDEIIVENDCSIKEKDSGSDDNESSSVIDKPEVEVESKAHKNEEKLKIKFSWESNSEINQSEGNKVKSNSKSNTDTSPLSKEGKSIAADASPINALKLSPSPSIKDLLTKNLKRTPQNNSSGNENCVSRSTEKDCCTNKTNCEDNGKGDLEVVIIANISENSEEVVRAAAAEVSSDGFELSGKLQPVKESSSQSGSSTPHSATKKQSITSTPDSTSSTSLENTQCENSKTPTVKKKMTPKQLEKYQTLEKNRELREKQKEEREKKKAEEKAEKERLKKEKQEKKEKEKQEKEKQKQVELEAKEEEKRRKDEEKKKKEEAKLLEKQRKEEARLLEKQKKEEEKKQKEEEKKKIEEEAQKKKNREKAVFASFFVPKKALAESNGSPVHAFMPFVIKADMRLAPCVRSTLTSEMYEAMDNSIQSQTATALYLSQLKTKNIVPRKSGKTWPIEERKDDPDIEIIDDEEEELPEGKENIILETHDTKQPHVKLLSFQENRRPPYWGTWQKISNKIMPRRPFSKDEHFFDYEVDSDDEWEDEGEGDSLSNSEDEKEPEDDYEVDNEFFVPHGYLSEEEANDEDEMPSPETHKAKLKLKEQEFEEELKKKTHKIKPRLIGCLWMGDKNNNAAYDQLLKILHPYEAVLCTSCAASPIPTTLSIPPQKGQDSPDVTGTPTSSATQSGGTAIRQKGFKRKKITGDTRTLVELVHGSTKKKPFLARELLSYWKQKDEVASSDGEKVVDAAHSANSSLVK